MVRAIDRSVGRITKAMKMRGSAIIRSWFSQATMEALAILAFRRLCRSEDGSSPTLRRSPRAYVHQVAEEDRAWGSRETPVATLISC